MHSAYYDGCVFWEIPRIAAAYWDRPFVDTVLLLVLLTAYYYYAPADRLFSSGLLLNLLDNTERPDHPADPTHVT